MGEFPSKRTFQFKKGGSVMTMQKFNDRNDPKSPIEEMFYEMIYGLRYSKIDADKISLHLTKKGQGLRPMLKEDEAEGFCKAWATDDQKRIKYPQWVDVFNFVQNMEERKRKTVTSCTFEICNGSGYIEVLNGEPNEGYDYPRGCACYVGETVFFKLTGATVSNLDGPNSKLTDYQKNLREVNRWEKKNKIDSYQKMVDLREKNQYEKHKNENRIQEVSSYKKIQNDFTLVKGAA